MRFSFVAALVAMTLSWPVAAQAPGWIAVGGGQRHAPTALSCPVPAGLKLSATQGDGSAAACAYAFDCTGRDNCNPNSIALNLIAGAPEAVAVRNYDELAAQLGLTSRAGPALGSAPLRFGTRSQGAVVANVGLWSFPGEKGPLYLMGLYVEPALPQVQALGSAVTQANRPATTMAAQRPSAAPLECPKLVPAPRSTRTVDPDAGKVMQLSSLGMINAMSTGNMWVMLASTEVCLHQPGDQSWSLNYAQSNDLALVESRYRQWMGSYNQPVTSVSLGGAAGLSSVNRSGVVTELYRAGTSGRGAAIIVSYTPATQKAAAEAAVRAALSGR